MSPPAEGPYAKLAVLVAVLGVIIAFLAWRYPSPSPVVSIPPETPERTPLAPVDIDNEETPDDAARKSEEILRRSPRPTSPSPTPSPEVPLEFTLENGEQKVLLSGQAAVSAQFNQLGEENFLTLHIAAGGESTPYAALVPGKRLTLRIQEKEYYLSLLRLDLSGKTARIRIDRAQ
jgi:hypothetical protein